MKRYILMLSGFISLGLGILGIILPLLPTTPFLLLSASCFYKSSPRFHSWLLNNKVFGKHIRNYEENRAIAPRTRWIALMTMWAAIGFSTYIFWHTVFVPICLITVALIGSWYILSLRTM